MAPPDLIEGKMIQLFYQYWSFYQYRHIHKPRHTHTRSLVVVEVEEELLLQQSISSNIEERERERENRAIFVRAGSIEENNNQMRKNQPARHKAACLYPDPCVVYQSC